MEYVRLGRTGLKVSRLCLGCMTFGTPQWKPWALDAEASKPFFKLAVERGINFFDTANMYSRGASEEVTGRWLKEFARRDEIVIATKVNGKMGEGPNMAGLSRKHIMDAADASLRRLGVDYIDLYQIHRFDPQTPIEETLQALDDLVRAGKVRYLGISNTRAWQVAVMLGVSERNGWAKFASMQPHYNLVYREEERELLPLCLSQGLGVIPWSPLARGFLSRPRTPPKSDVSVRASVDDLSVQYYYTDPDFAVLDAVGEIAGAHGATRSQVALAWMLTKPAITGPIVGASKIHHLEEAFGALDLKLSAEEVARLEAPYVPKPVITRV